MATGAQDVSGKPNPTGCDWLKSYVALSEVETLVSACRKNKKKKHPCSWKKRPEGSVLISLMWCCGWCLLTSVTRRCRTVFRLRGTLCCCSDGADISTRGAAVFCAFDPTSLCVDVLLFICLFCNKSARGWFARSARIGSWVGPSSRWLIWSPSASSRSKHVSSCVREMIENSV